MLNGDKYKLAVLSDTNQISENTLQNSDSSHKKIALQNLTWNIGELGTYEGLKSKDLIIENKSLQPNMYFYSQLRFSIDF